MSYRVYDEFEQIQIKKTEHGKLFVSVDMPEDEWLIGYILSFGKHVEIIEPTYLKKIVAEQVKRNLRKIYNMTNSVKFYTATILLSKEVFI